MVKRVQDLPAGLIDPAPVPLRPVNELSPQYLDMVTQFKEDGHFGKSILVRPIPKGRYEVVDGMYRWTAGHEAGLPYFQCIIREMDDSEVIRWQVKLNATSVETIPMEYAQHLKRLMDMEGEEMTLKDLAELVGKSRSWVCQMLSLNNLRPEYQKMVSRGQLMVGKAQLLSKLKPYLQPDYIHEARIQTVAEFRKTVAAAVNKFRENLRQGKFEKFWSHEIIPYIKSLKEINAELSNWHAGARMIAQYECISPLDGWKLAIQWITNMDPGMLEFRKKKMQRDELAKLEESKRLKALREERKRTLDCAEDSEYDN